MISSSSGEPSKNIRPFSPWLIFLSYALLTMSMTWPVLGQLGSYIPGRIGDAYVHLWNFNWLEQALLTGHTPYQTDLLFYPNGANLINHNIAWLHFFIWLPLQAIVGGPEAYSLVYLLAFPLNGVAMYLLAREFTLSATAAYIAGLIFAFWPYNLSHHGHPNLVLMCWLPLTLLFLRRLLQHGRWRDAVWTAVCVALLGLTRWQLLIMGGFLIGLYLLYEFITNAHTRTLRAWGQLTAVGLLSLLLMAPLLAPVLSYQLRRDNPADLLVAEEAPYPTDLLAYFVPSSYQPWWGEAALQLSGHFVGQPIYTRAIGYMTLLLAIVGVVRCWRQSWFWLLAALFYILLALGPQLTINGVPSWPLPYRWIENSFIIQLVRFPDRFNSVLGIPIAMLAAYGVTALLAPPFSKWAIKPIYLTSLCALFILVEYASHFATMPLATPVWYEALASEPGDGAILDIPMETQGRFDKTYMLYQLTHGRSLVEGHVSRPSREMFNFIDSVPLLHDSRDKRNPPENVVNVSDQFHLLAEANIPYLILHKQFLRPEQEASWRQWLIIQPTYEDEDLIVYRTDPPQLGRDYETTAVLSPDINLISATFTPDSVRQGEWLTIHSQWASTAVIDQDYDVCVLIDDADPTCQPLTPNWPTSRWDADALIQTSFQLQPSPFLSDGPHTVQLALQAEAELLDTAVAIGQLTAESLPRTFTLPHPEQATVITWNDAIRLVGYDLSAEPTLTLYWQALRRLPTSYKIFIHLIDDAGNIVAQVDYVPQNWAYPTNWWEADEYVQDEVVLPITDLPTGTYELWLGVYDPDTNVRLVPQTAVAQPSNDNAIHLLTLQR